MQAGTPNGWRITPSVLAASAELWNGASVYVDHPTFFESPSVSRLVGVICAPHFDSQAACMKAQVHVLALHRLPIPSNCRTPCWSCAPAATLLRQSG